MIPFIQLDFRAHSTGIRLDISFRWCSNIYIKYTLRSEAIFNTECSLEMMKNAFYFTLKSIFILKVFKFLSCLFGHAKNGLIRKVGSISKIDNGKTCDAISWEVKGITQLAHDVKKTLDFGCLLVATSDNVKATLWQRCLCEIVAPTKI